MDTSPHKSNFINVNSIRLHYLDWGGEGETLIFLAGMGCSGHIFDHIAPRFTDKFHVMALTRRGHGESDHPKTGYELDILVNDILGFMDSQGIDKAILAGHSLAGVELTYFAEKYPERISKLIYLDAVHDPKGMKEILQQAPPPVDPPFEKTEFSTEEEYIEYMKYLRPDLVLIWNESLEINTMLDLEKNTEGKFIEKKFSHIERQILTSVTAYEPYHANIRVPVLRFEAQGAPLRPAFYTEEQRKAADDFHRKRFVPFSEQVTARFKKEIPQAKVIDIPDGHHYCFIAQEELVYEEMRKFLL